MGIIEDLKRDEGFRPKPYRCTAGKLTIGYGRNIEDVGINEAEAEMLLCNDIEEATADLMDIFPGWFDYMWPKKEALVNMRFNLGPARFRKFKKMISAVKAEDWQEAAKQAKDSKWYNQVGDRAKRIVATLAE